MLELGYVSSQQKLGADQDYETGSLVAVAPYSGRHGTLLSRLEIGRVLSEDSPPERALHWAVLVVYPVIRRMNWPAAS